MNKTLQAVLPDLRRRYQSARQMLIARDLLLAT